jgi:hypothetical protein
VLKEFGDARLVVYIGVLSPKYFTNSSLISVMINIDNVVVLGFETV